MPEITINGNPFLTRMLKEGNGLFLKMLHTHAIKDDTIRGLAERSDKYEAINGKPSRDLSYIIVE